MTQLANITAYRLLHIELRSASLQIGVRIQLPLGEALCLLRRRSPDEPIHGQKDTPDADGPACTLELVHSFTVP